MFTVKYSLTVFLFLIFVSFTVYSRDDYPAPDRNCLSCHHGLAPIRQNNTEMMREIYDLGKKAGDPNGCIVCHGGDPSTTKKEQAHRGTVSYFLTHDGPKEYYPDPGSSWINQNTCGLCHPEQIRSQMNSLMMTEQGKIQGTLWGFGGLEGYHHDIGNYVTSNPDDPHARLGTEAYRKYMQVLHDKNPQVYPAKMKKLPPAPTADEVQGNPQLAAYTYLRQECLRCHTGSKGRKKRGDYRGMGCSACHIPYSNNGFYEGNDLSVPENEAGHMLVHAIQGGRDARVTIHGKSWSGVPVETCTTCHNRGKRIGVSYQGLMETEYNPTYDRYGNGQPGLHSKHYMHLQEDVHYKKGMLCQDCHTSNDLHGDGFLAGSTLAPVEIECQDCHGTPQKYPWELPLGSGDEYDTLYARGAARGVSGQIPSYLNKGRVYDPRDGYLLTARGNPFTNVVKTGDSVLVHLAGGRDLTLEPLKKLTGEKKLSKEGRTAMSQVEEHMERLECYTCHATWAPQCYGCHIKIDYSGGKRHTDWLAAATDHDARGLTGGWRGDLDKYLIDGEVTETRSYLRWEDPPLSQNGEGRISPTIPGCQTTVTVIGKDGNALLQNHIFRIPNVEGAGEEGQLGIDMSPVNPHTVQKEARHCESCHDNPAALGYGIGEGKYFADRSEDLVVDLMTAGGMVLPNRVTVQKPAIPNLHMDWSRFVDEQGHQLQTVGHHFKLSGPLSGEARIDLDKRGVCLACHQTIPNRDPAVSLMAHTSEAAGLHISRQFHAGILHKVMLMGAWLQVLGGLITGAGILFLLWRFWKKRKKV